MYCRCVGMRVEDCYKEGDLYDYIRSMLPFATYTTCDIFFTRMTQVVALRGRRNSTRTDLYDITL